MTNTNTIEITGVEIVETILENGAYDHVHHNEDSMNDLVDSYNDEMTNTKYYNNPKPSFSEWFRNR